MLRRLIEWVKPWFDGALKQQPIAIGDEFEMRDYDGDPWRKKPVVVVVDLADGWVRYKFRGRTIAWSMRLDDFRNLYRSIDA